MIKVQGRSITKEFVRCRGCKKDFVWLKVDMIEDGLYHAVCAECRRKSCIS